ncbi:MAG TPA: tetratricopeptide repeat protein [Bryobacteraceae bacterium]|nr:tetratricopeptide repeat protein [Bryobacteraceae bacterium]HXJ42151.1 tetratricopeptide repeat protein [Bryobacteraceae bacterium]
MAKYIRHWSALSMCPISQLLMVCSLASAGESGYLGRDVCAGCHKDIAIMQSRTNMAQAWPGVATQQLPPNYSEIYAEGPAPVIEYAFARTGRNMQYRVQMPGQPLLEFPVEATIGGVRHGISFLVRVTALEGLPLSRPALVEARYFHYAQQNRLALELGFPEEKPSTYETALGRVLTPLLEKRCLACHGALRTRGTRVESGIDCESCHGPGQRHLAALGAHSRDLGILNPKKLPVAERMRPCAQCHAGSSVVEDPIPYDTLISNQVTALKNTECWRQSGGEITCSDCHDPHRDASALVLSAKSEKACLRCHSAKLTNHAALCPVDRISGCTGCHMPDQTRGAFVMADHWIRVHPEQKIEVAAHNPAWRTKIPPKHLYLRMMVFNDREKASAVRQQLLAGGSFFELARANSIDRATADTGGYLGDLDRSQLDPALSAAALKLQPGEISNVVESNGKYFTLQRLPRDFREDAAATFNKAMELRKQGKLEESKNKLFEALKTYPRLLRALNWLAAMYTQGGNPGVSVRILTLATRLYPEDSDAHFNLALAYGAMGNAEEVAEYRRTMEIDPDLVVTYINWGAALYEKGQYQDAIKVYRQGINVNPLLASLHYSLALALEQEKKTAEAKAEMALARKIDPNVGTR